MMANSKTGNPLATTAPLGERVPQTIAPPAASSTNVAAHPGAKRMPTVVAVGKTDKGKVRELNEDQFLVAQIRTQLEIGTSSFDSVQPHARLGGTLLVVADGMGGHPAGEQASALAVNAIKQVVASATGWFAECASGSQIIEALHAGFARADETLDRVSAREPQLAGMGTTMTAAFVRGTELFVAHAGDSPAYLFRQGQLWPLTKDHTVARALVEAGVLPEDASHQGAWSHVVTNAVGGNAGGAKPESWRGEVLSGDRILICTDGLTRMLSASDIAALLEANPDRDAAVEALIAGALERGGVDNITAVLADVVG